MTALTAHDFCVSDRRKVGCSVIFNGVREGSRRLLHHCILRVSSPLSNHLSSVLGPRSQKPLKRHIFSSDVGVQTETVVITPAMQPQVYEQLSGEDAVTDDSDMSPLSLSVADLSSILKWSKEISSDINLAAGLCLRDFDEYPFTYFCSSATVY